MSAQLHPTIAAVTERISRRSADLRKSYEDQLAAARGDEAQRGALSCGNLAHAFAASPESDKLSLRGTSWPNLAIINSYNDMLSAHQPLGAYPEILKEAARGAGATAQIAGGVPAMCDGVTQGRRGMELSLFSRDVIAMATAVGLSHNMFDGGLCLGVCDKIVPGMLMGALRFGHLPFIFVPAGPMPSGLPNPEKARIRQLFAEGKVGRDELLKAESDSYHAAGTCTFYGTANSNQMLMELMGLHVPGSAFINPGTPLRDALVRASADRCARITAMGDEYAPIGEIVNAKAIVNAVVGLHATGGSTNHTIHLIAIARAAGLILDWQDFEQLSRVTPLLTRIYPNGQADVNHFHAAGGLGFVIRELMDAGLVHGDVKTVWGHGLADYAKEPFLTDDVLEWRDAPAESGNTEILGTVAAPFSPEGGLKLLEGNIGRAVIKTSAVKPEHRVVEQPAIVFHSQDEFMERFGTGELDRDFVAVLRFQGARANGMPELHKLTPLLGSLQDRGFRVALVTDGRMSGASGKVPAGIHVSPEAALRGPIARVRDGDIIRIDGVNGELRALVDPEEFMARPLATADLTANAFGMGRELFGGFRENVSTAEEGAIAFPELAVSATAFVDIPA